MIVASICTIPIRKESFLQVAHRILYEQTVPIDQMHVWLNGYQEIDSDLPFDKRIIYHLEPSNPGPWIRYRAAEDLSNTDLFVTLDDDLVYPTNYLEAGVAVLGRHPNSVICFGGLLWSPLYHKLSYGSNRWNYMMDKSLSSAKLVAVIKGQGGFFPAKLSKDLTQLILPGFRTNDDMMVSYLLQKRGVDIWCAAHPANWVLENEVSNAEHALYHRDSSIRVETFSQMVNQLDFDPTAGLLNLWKATRERIVVFSDSCPPQPDFLVDEHLVTDLCKPDCLVLLVTPAQGELASQAQSIVDTPYILLPVFVPDSKGRFSDFSIIQSWRELRVHRLAAKSIKLIRSQLKKELQPTAIYHLSKGALTRELA